MADVVDVEVLAQPEQDPRIEAGIAAMSPTGVRDDIRNFQWQHYARAQVANILAAADLVDPVRGEVRLHRQQRAAAMNISDKGPQDAPSQLGYEGAYGWASLEPSFGGCRGCSWRYQ